MVVEQWTPGTQYNTNELVVHNDVQYFCNIGHKALSVWSPNVAYALWRPVCKTDGSLQKKEERDELARELAEVKEKMKSLSKENEILKTHIECSPDGEAFFAAQEDFQKRAAIQNQDTT